MEHNHESAALRKLLSFFPNDPIRPAQAAALRVIAHMFREDRGFAIIEAPTGAGKSALAVTTALYSASLDDERFEPGAYILTPYNNLAMQMTDTFGDKGLASLKSSMTPQVASLQPQTPPEARSTSTMTQAIKFR